jgi:hypothetical protein
MSCSCEYGHIAGLGATGVGVVCDCDSNKETLGAWLDARSAHYPAGDFLGLSEEEETRMPPSTYLDKHGEDHSAEEVEQMSFNQRVQLGITTVLNPSESPILREQQAEIRKADKERAKYADKVRAEATRQLEEEADSEKFRADVERMKHSIMNPPRGDKSLQTRADRLYDEQGERIMRPGEVDLPPQRIDRLSDPSSPVRTGDLYQPQRPAQPVDHPVSIAPMTHARGTEKEAIAS